ncbi:unnamed protein product, partial [Anisakis simplex]|uniref:Cullin-5 (inferred by orthology to a C. elegans protein) n=1 Tax=Anisakis simplex TaxID=6269 RepID=A0A0M3KKP6_ANISI
MQVQMPRELEEFIPEVDEFYKKQHSGRKLQWLHHWSHGTVKNIESESWLVAETCAARLAQSVEHQTLNLAVA